MTAFNKAAVSTELKRDSSLAMNAIKRFSADQCTAQAASIAFYSAFSLAPTLLMVIAVAGWFFGAEAARGQIFAQVHNFLGNDSAAAIQAIVENAHRQGGSGVAAIMSAALLIVGASATFSSLNTALNVVFPALPRERRSGIALMVRVRLISFGLVLGVAFLLVVTLVLDTAVSFVGKMIWGDSPFVIVGDIIQTILSFIVLAGAFTALMKLLPDATVKWRDALVGGLVAALLFTIGKKLFAVYLAHAGTASAFGAAGSLAVLLMWLYFSSAVFLLGGEFAAVKGGFSKRKDASEKAAQKAAEDSETEREQGSASDAAVGNHAATSGRAKSSLAGGALQSHAPKAVALASHSPAAPTALAPTTPVPGRSANANGLSELFARWKNNRTDRIEGTGGARRGQVRAASRRTSPIDVWIDQSKHPVALRLAKYAAPLLLQGVSLILPMGRKRLLRSLATRSVVAAVGSKLIGAGKRAKNRPGVSPASADRVNANRVNANKVKQNTPKAGRDGHPVSAAVFAAVTGLVLAALANRKEGGSPK